MSDHPAPAVLAARVLVVLLLANVLFTHGFFSVADQGRPPLRHADRHRALRRAADAGRARHDARHRHRRHRPLRRLRRGDLRRARAACMISHLGDQNSRRRRARRDRRRAGALAWRSGSGTASWSPSLGIQPIIATLVLMVAGRGIAQLITERPDHHDQQRPVQVLRRRLLARRAVRDPHRHRGLRRHRRCSAARPRWACSSSPSAATPRPRGWPASARAA